jgi:hypothetical protein
MPATKHVLHGGNLDHRDKSGSPKRKRRRRGSLRGSNRTGRRSRTSPQPVTGRGERSRSRSRSRSRRHKDRRRRRRRVPRGDRDLRWRRRFHRRRRPARKEKRRGGCLHGRPLRQIRKRVVIGEQYAGGESPNRPGVHPHKERRPLDPIPSRERQSLLAQLFQERRHAGLSTRITVKRSPKLGQLALDSQVKTQRVDDTGAPPTSHGDHSECHARTPARSRVTGKRRPISNKPRSDWMKASWLRRSAIGWEEGMGRGRERQRPAPAQAATQKRRRFRASWPSPVSR